MPPGSVGVPPSIVGGQKVAEGGQKIIVTARPQLDQSDPGGGVRHENVQQTVAS